MTQNPDPAAKTRQTAPSGSDIELGWLANDLPFLTRTLRVLLGPQSDVMRQDLDLQPGEIGVMSVIDHNPGLSQNDLAASVVLKKSAVTKLIHQLERRGLVVRSRSVSDRRSNELHLTERGKALCDRIQQASQTLHDEWLAGIGAEDQEVFFEVLTRLIAGLNARACE